jgi:hypothetical protein
MIIEKTDYKLLKQIYAKGAFGNESERGIYPGVAQFNADYKIGQNYG